MTMSDNNHLDKLSKKFKSQTHPYLFFLFLIIIIIIIIIVFVVVVVVVVVDILYIHFTPHHSIKLCASQICIGLEP